MGLRLPQAVSIDRFQGGYKATSDYSDLADTETNEAQNVIYTPGSDLEQRKGSEKLYNTSLKSTGGTAGRPITGHVYFDKLGLDSGFNVVAAGDNLYKYTSATASVIYSGLTDNSQTYWHFAQVQDPRSASDDILLMANGSNPILLWNGSGTAIRLDSLTSASGVPIGKDIINHRNRIYVANIEDSADVDASVKVVRTGFGADGAPNPHIFNEEFYVGGSDKDGEIKRQKLLNDQIIYYREKSIWKFNPSIGDVNDLQKVVSDLGLYAPFSLVDAGSFHIFLSERGIFLFDGSIATHVSTFVDTLLLENTNQQQLKYAKGIYDNENNRYILYFPYQGQSRNNIGLVLDLKGIQALESDYKQLYWQPPVWGREVNYISTFIDTQRRTRIIYGDYRGYLYEDQKGKNDGIEIGYNDTAASATANTITASSVVFPTSNDGLAGVIAKIVSGVGEGQSRVISSNTSAILTVETDWGVTPNSASTFSVGGIDSYWRSKDYNFGAHDVVKIFRSLDVRLKEQGNFNLDIYYMIDFKRLNEGTKKAISMYQDGFIWGISKWGAARWGGRGVIKKHISLRSTNTQRTNGTHVAFRFGNNQANQEWKVSGFDVTLNLRGKR